MTPLPRLPHLRVVPVRGLTVVHHLGALGAAWSTYESHRKRTVRGEPDSWDPPVVSSHERKSFLVMQKKNIPPVDSWDPSDLVSDLWAY